MAIRVYDRERVTLALEALNESLDHEYVARCQAEQASQRRAPRSIEEIQARWKYIPGSFADLIINERRDH